MNDYDDTLEFKQLLRAYERSKRQGKVSYFDSDDYVDIAEYYMRNERLEDALNAVEDGLMQHGFDDSLRSIKANVLISMQRFDDARKIVNTLKVEDDPDVFYFRGQLACADGESFAVRSQWFHDWIEEERADCEQMDDDEEAHTRMREAYMHVVLSIVDLSAEDDIGQILTEWVDEYVEQCTPLEGDDIDLDIARACHDAGLVDKEIELYRLFLDVNPYLHQGYTYLASLQSTMNYNSEAVESAEFALAINSNDSQAQLVKALGNYQLTNYEQAAADFSRFMDMTGDGVYYSMLASCLMRCGRKEEACQCLQQAQEYTTHKISDPEIKAGARVFMSEIYMMGGYYAEALKMVNMALKPNRQVPEFLMQKGIILLAQKKTVRAMRAFLEAVSVADRKFPFLTLAGGELMAKGYTEIAMMLLNMALRYKNDPDYPKLYIYLAQGFYLMHEPKAFLHYLKKACKATPELVKTCWADELIGIAADNYFETLKSCLLSRMPNATSTDVDVPDPDNIFDMDTDIMPF